ncbi:hypothetical protein [Lelliottia aquatilis]|uniref:hypothetical protein n=1 Tax=Lelliottia aquatilis TaxID=2080838 RepID=UPI00192BC18D|nr:hypothetical protein [Lelliottia aquatilis]MBL5884360.1 hypothetical protein [Lelliottia aquatilis]
MIHAKKESKRTLIGKIFLWLFFTFCAWFFYSAIKAILFLYDQRALNISGEIFNIEELITLVMMGMLLIIGCFLGFLAWLTRGKKPESA